MMRSIPNVAVKKIGNKKNAIRTITGYVELSCWDGYFLEEATPYSKKEKFVQSRKIELTVNGLINPDGSFECIEEQVNAYDHLVEHEKTIQHAILQTLVHDFPRLLADDYKYYDLEEGGFPHLSKITSGFDFKNYIGPNSISIEEMVKDDVAYVTWYFRCRWDPEHGFQVVTHKDRIIDIGQDTDIWKIFKDNGTYEQELSEYNQKVWPVRSRKKKWWQFWE